MSYIRLAQIFIIFPTLFIFLRVQSYLTGALFLLTSLIVLKGKKDPLAYPKNIESRGILINLFILYILAWFLISPSSNGFQNVSSIILLLLMIHYKIIWAKVAKMDLEKTFKYCFVLLSIGYLAQVLNFGLGSDVIYPPRTTSSILMIGTIYYTYLFVERRCGIIVLTLALISLFATLSRASIGGALIGMQFIYLLRHGKQNHFRKFFSLTLVQIVFYFFLVIFEPLRSRFTFGDNEEVLGFRINTSGRLNIWKLTISEWKKSPIFGNGPGSTKITLQQYFPNISHPHNEYLRILHDFGILGLSFWILICIFSIKNILKLRNLSQGINHSWQNFRLALLSSFLFAISFENYIVYIFFILPFAVFMNREYVAETT